ncbi:hypothetical protein E2562_029413 [Oryza meyeriana var. granulata]|uniref:Uncharacterized protein n=1 Tax=Oryza meyeriana var. granulata TaxID=110450 RepID=A0A6G1C0G0_9ORYZ|nr:hypothetical protein E2562_029413 [Oryza meyeriana var. granulata]
MQFPFAAGDYPADQVDPDYLYFLRHIRPDGDSYTLELPSDGVSPPSLVKYEAPADDNGTDVECVSDPSPGRASTNRPLAEEKESSVEVDAEAAPSWIDSLVGIDEDYRLFLKHTRVVNDNMVLEIDGVVVNYPCAACSESSSSEVEDAREKGETKSAIDSDEPVVIVPDPKVCDWVAEGDEDEGRLTASALQTIETTKMKTNSSNGNDASPSVPPGLQGIIWPKHINSRPDSDFKRRLLDVLSKPFSRKEYIKLFDMASIRTPLVKLRQVRNDAKFYPTEEMGNSYFDHYPDLVEQVMHTSYPNGLALMRGFFFWLQNNAHEDQFRPWVDVSKDHEVIPLID